MQRFSTFLTLLLVLYTLDGRCSPDEAVYEDDLPDLSGNDPLFDDSDSYFQPLLDQTPNLIAAVAEEPCSGLNLTPNRKVRAREAVCPASSQEPSTTLEIPDLDIFHNTNYLCPFDMGIGLRVLVCGKPVSVEGLTPDILTTVQDARLCKFMRMLTRDWKCLNGWLQKNNYAETMHNIMIDPRLPEIKCEWPDFVFCCEQINEVVSFTATGFQYLDHQVLTWIHYAAQTCMALHCDIF